MAQDLFREQALRHLASPEQTDMQLRLTPPRAWLGLVGVLLLLAALVYWAAVGQLYRKVDGNGFLLGQEDIEIAVIYVSLEEGKRVKPGMAVHIFPDADTFGEYDYILATVLEVSPYPVDAKAMRIAQFSEDAATLLQNQVGPAPFEVVAQLEVMGEETRVAFSPGTPCTAMIIIGEAHPLELILPGMAPGF